MPSVLISLLSTLLMSLMISNLSFSSAICFQLLEAERFGVIGPQIVQTLTTFQEALTASLLREKEQEQKLADQEKRIALLEQTIKQLAKQP